MKNRPGDCGIVHDGTWRNPLHAAIAEMASLSRQRIWQRPQTRAWLTSIPETRARNNGEITSGSLVLMDAGKNLRLRRKVRQKNPLQRDGFTTLAFKNVAFQPSLCAGPKPLRRSRPFVEESLFAEASISWGPLPLKRPACSNVSVRYDFSNSGQDVEKCRGFRRKVL